MKKIMFKFLVLLLAVCGLCSFASSCSNKNELTILYEQDKDMINTYTVIAVDPNAPFVDSVSGEPKAPGSVTLNTTGADALINWMLSSTGLDTIKNFGYKEYGEYLFYLLDGHPTSTATVPAATDATKKIRLSTTTSVKDSGLLGYILPIFEKQYGYEVEVASAGTGKAISAAKYGNADLILVHAKAQEEAFVTAQYARKVTGFSAERISFMYNYFVLIGPKADPAKVKEAASVKDAFKAIANGKYTFVSRADNSGTHTKELALWDTELGIKADAESYKDYSWYIGANAGMGACLTMAKEKAAYILSDKATFLTFKANGFQVAA